jgi:hypothetical protein
MASRRAPHFGPFCFYGVKNQSLVKLYSFLISSNEWPFLCVKASAQKASRAKVQKWLKNKFFIEVCMAGIELATARPKKVQALCLPSNPPTMLAASQGGTSLGLSADFKFMFDNFKSG